MGTINNFGDVLLPAGSNTIDVQSLLTAAITAAQAPLQALQSQQATVETQSSALQSIQSDITSLSTAVSALSDPTGAINALNAASSDPSLLTASADSTAQAGTHSIVINSLATTSSEYTNAVASGTTAIATGSFQIAVGSGAPRFCPIQAVATGMIESQNKRSKLAHRMRPSTRVTVCSR